MLYRSAYSFAQSANSNSGANANSVGSLLYATASQVA